MTTSTIKHLPHEGDVVELAVDLPTEGLKAGIRGVVAEAFTEPTEAYDIEFEDENGEYVGMAYSLKPDQILNISRAVLERGFELLNRRDLAGAEREFRRAVGYNPRYADDITSSILRSKSDDPQAVAVLLRLVLRVDPSCSRARNNLAIAYAKLGVGEALEGRLEESIKTFHMGIELGPSEKIAEGLRADISVAYAKLGQRAYEAKTQNGDMAAEAESRRPLEISIDYMKMAVAFNPTDAAIRANLSLAYAHLAMHYLDLGEPRKSIQLFDMMDQTGVVRADLLNEYGVALAMSGQMEEAANVLERALEMLPHDDTIQSNLRRATEKRAGAFEMIHPGANPEPFLPSEFSLAYAAA
jgi:tetratricopeptide (TPR) repeat protein